MERKIKDQQRGKGGEPTLAIFHASTDLGKKRGERNPIFNAN